MVHALKISAIDTTIPLIQHVTIIMILIIRNSNQLGVGLLLGLSLEGYLGFLLLLVLLGIVRGRGMPRGSWKFSRILRITVAKVLLCRTLHKVMANPMDSLSMGSLFTDSLLMVDPQFLLYMEHQFTINTRNSKDQSSYIADYQDYINLSLNII